MSLRACPGASTCSSWRLSLREIEDEGGDGICVGPARTRVGAGTDTAGAGILIGGATGSAAGALTGGATGNADAIVIGAGAGAGTAMGT